MLGGGEPAPCSSTSNNPVHMREHLYPRTCRAEAAQQEAKKGTAKGKKEGDQGRRRERPSGEQPAPRQDGRQAGVHKGGPTHASRGAMYSHGTVEERERKEGTGGRNKTDALKPLEGGMALVNVVDE